MSAEAGRTVIGQMLDEWHDLRRAVRRAEVVEHPDVTDVLGRVWVWKGGGLYVHDSMAWPLAFVERPDLQGPRPGLLDNPNYRWCNDCRAALVAKREASDGS